MQILRKIIPYLQLRLLQLLGKAYFNLQKRATGRANTTIQPPLSNPAGGTGTGCYIQMAVNQGRRRWQPFILEFNTADGPQRMILYALDHYHAAILLEEFTKSKVLIRKVVLNP